MDYDLLIKNGRIVDGTGKSSYIGDVAVTDGTIVATGEIKGTANKVIDATGLAVTPGFIDHHTHLDAQMFWDPYGTCEPQHGVTSVVMGNCGLSLAPVEAGFEDSLVKSFIRVEAMPRKTLEQGVPWGWKSYRDYLDALEGSIGINVGGLVGHIALRHAAMGEEAVERAASGDEVERMKAMVFDALEGGALGLSTNRNHRHTREDGKPVASRLADDVEFDALCNVLGEKRSGVIETIYGLQQVEQINWYHHLAKLTRRPIIWQVILHRWSSPNLWREQLDALDRVFNDGCEAYGLTNTTPISATFSMKNVQVFDEFPTWQSLSFLPTEAKRQAMEDQGIRQKLRAEMADTTRQTSFHRRWDLVWVVKAGRPENQRFVGGTVAAMAQARNQDPIDALLDISLEEDFDTMFWNANSGGDPAAMAQIITNPHVLVGVSDAGAHVEFDANFGYGTTLLGLWCRDRGIISLEGAVQKLTSQVASIYGIDHRGTLKSGYAADIAIFDPETVGPGANEWAYDLPGDARRLVQPAVGMHFTIVNGKIICEDGHLSGDLPGSIIRGSAHKP